MQNPPKLTGSQREIIKKYENLKYHSPTVYP